MKTQKQQLIDSINEYVRKNGIGTIADSITILRIAGLSKSKGNILPSDYCYNRYNIALKNFEGPFLFEYLGINKFKILGENYSYSGKIYHKPKGDVEQVIGEWINGHPHIYK